MLALWSLLIYAPLCHWVWGPGGWIAEMGALDFAGGAGVAEWRTLVRDHT